MRAEWNRLVVEPGFQHYRAVGAPTLNVCNPDEMLNVNFTDEIIPINLPFAFAIHFMFRERDVVVRYGDANSKSDLAQIFISGPLQRKTGKYKENRRLRTYRHETKRQGQTDPLQVADVQCIVARIGRTLGINSIRLSTRAAVRFDFVSHGLGQGVLKRTWGDLRRVCSVRFFVWCLLSGPLVSNGGFDGGGDRGYLFLYDVLLEVILFLDLCSDSESE